MIRALIRVTIFFVGFSPSLAARGDGPPADLTVEQIWRVATERQNRIKNLKGTFRLSWEMLAPYPPETDSLSVDPDEIEFALDGDRRFQRRTPLLADAKEFAETRVFEAGDTTLLLRADKTPSGSWRTREASIIGGKDAHCDSDMSYYSEEALQVPTQDFMIARIEDSPIYPHCIRPIKERPSYYHVAPAQEMVDGALCHVVESFFDRIWVDPSLDCVIRKRENLDRDEHGASYVANRYVVSQFVEAAPGVHVPKKLVREMFGRRSWPARYHNKPFLRLTLEASAVGINNVTDDDFKVSIPAGTFIGDARTGEVYRIRERAAGRIDELALESKKYLPAGAARRTWVFAAIAVLIVFTLWFAARGRRRAGASPNSGDGVGTA